MTAEEALQKAIEDADCECGMTHAADVMHLLGELGYRIAALQMTLTEAASIIGTSPDNLRQAIARGSLRAEKLGRDWWVQEAEVERYKRESHRAQSTVQPT